MFDLSEILKDCAPMTVAEKPSYPALERARELQELGMDWVAAQLRDKVLLAEKLECVAKEGYLVITPAKIKAFLERKAASYNEEVVKKHGKTKDLSRRIEDYIFAPIGQPVITSGPSLQQSSFINSLTNSFTGSLLNGPIASNQAQWIGSGITTEGISSRFIFDDQDEYRALTQDFLSPAKDRIAGFVWKETPVKDYKAIPPENALEALREARAKEIFDDFTIASVEHMKDPLLLGRLNGTKDRYFLAQWGDDIALDDVI